MEIGLLRSALYRAAREGGEEGLAHDELTSRVFDALDLPLERYASNPSARFKQLSDTQTALRDVLGHRLYRDLERGWRVTSPNLEQCGLLKISYDSLDEVCEAEDVWQENHAALVERHPRDARQGRHGPPRRHAPPPGHKGRLPGLQLPGAHPPAQQPEPDPTLGRGRERGDEVRSHPLPRSQRPYDSRDNAYLSARGGFGQYLRRSSTFEDYDDRLNLEETEEIIRGLLDGLTVAGIVEVVAEPNGEEDVPGYQIQASAMRWLAGDGTEPFHDPIRTPDRSTSGRGTNPFFVEFYSETAAGMQDLEAREHTAQVPYEVREEREESFREGRLPILYCSPTMELGVDISELNAVNLRNIPPTPANYAQRSGRAGRSGQPALVFAYCSIGSSHDQYFFKRPERMVAGAVSPPRLDLANEDLVRAHVQAIWLTETGQSLGRSLKDVLDVEGEEPSLELRDWVHQSFADEGARRRARERAGRVLASVEEELRDAPWYTEGWLDEVLDGVERAFDTSCDRWRTLYRAALAQRVTQNKIIGDASRSQRDKDQARRLRREAEAQLDLLISEADGVTFSDFYSYRYFASEGFLPGYSFPRLPISAFVPGSGRRHNREEFLSRPRFLAVSEFGPRASVYHEGARYLINRVILERDEQELLTTRAKQCENCGYFHPIPGQDDGPDLCENCGAALGAQLRQLFRLQNVSTVRRDRINSDEEERQRLGYELRTGVRFAGRDGDLSARNATLESNGEKLATLTYGNAATLWRINLGWTRRKNKDQLGFVLDTERGFWARTDQETTGDPEDPLSASTQQGHPLRRGHPQLPHAAPGGEPPARGPRLPPVRPEERHPGRLPAGGQRARRRTPALALRPAPHPPLRVGRRRRRRPAAPPRRSRRLRQGRRRSPPHLPLRPRDGRGPPPRPARQGRLRGRLLRLPHDLHEPDGPPHPRPPEHPQPPHAAHRSHRRGLPDPRHPLRAPGAPRTPGRVHAGEEVARLHRGPRPPAPLARPAPLRGGRNPPGLLLRRRLRRRHLHRRPAPRLPRTPERGTPPRRSDGGPRLHGHPVRPPGRLG